jgi:hypothetical protein
MGHGQYSVTSSVNRAREKGYDHLPREMIFTQRAIHTQMSPHGVTVRESRDSEEHPNSLAIVLGLDVTGSMGSVPHWLVKEGLTKSVSSIIQGGEPDPQVLFVAVGDHECDSSPLQVGQFESSDELLDQWLTQVYLEGGGGGNAGESYLLAWYFAAMHTSIDCFEKRGKKGFVFTIGDEPTLNDLPGHVVKTIMGSGQASRSTAKDLFEAASERYHVFHIHLKETGTGKRQTTIDGWKKLVGENLIVCERKEDICKAITDKVLQFTDFETGSDVVNKAGEAGEEML